MVYKGLQRPLVFKNLKGKYIGWGAGIAVGSFVVCIIMGNVFSIVAGLISLLVSFAGGISIILFKQRQGLYDRDAQAGCYIVRKLIRGKWNL